MRTVAILLSILFLSSSALAKGPDGDAPHPSKTGAHPAKPAKAKKHAAAKPKKTAAAHPKKKTAAAHPKKHRAAAKAKKAPPTPKP